MKTGKYVLQVISRSGFRSTVIFILFFVITACLFGTGMFTENLKNGSQKLYGRSYADMMIVPESYLDSTRDMLFKGKACSIMFKDDVISRITDIEGTETVTPQLYMETLALSCCAEEGIQVVAFDPETDFAVSQWSGISHEVNGYEALAGSGGNFAKGDTITLFGRDFTIAGILEETGMGYDNSIFIPYSAANEITASEQYKFMFGEKTGIVSMLLVKLEKDADINEVSKRMSEALEGTEAKVYPVDALSADLKSHIDLMSHLVGIVSACAVIIAVVSLFAMVTLTFRQRRRIAGSMLAAGCPRSRVLRYFAAEYLVLFAAGAAAGMLLICIILLPLHEQVKAALDMPYKLISPAGAISLAARTLGIDFVMLAAAVSVTFAGILRTEPALLMEEQT